MGWQIIKQEATDLLIDGQAVVPGKFCIRSSIVDNLIAFNCDETEVLERFIEAGVNRAISSSLRAIPKIIRNVDAGEPEKSYYHSVRSWAEVLAVAQDDACDEQDAT